MNLDSTTEDFNATPRLDDSLPTVNENEEQMEVEEVDGSETIIGANGKCKRKHTSSVWKFFDAFHGVDGKKRTKCKACGQVYIAEGTYGTGNMKRHIAKYPRLDTHNIAQMVLSGGSGQMGLTTKSSAIRNSSSTSDRGIGTSSEWESFSSETKDVMNEFDSFECEQFCGNALKSELELYLDEQRIDRKTQLDILSWWKANQFQYPQLSSMARDVLSIPISTVASESAFSVGGRVLDQFRSALKPECVEALVCTRDWLYGYTTEFFQPNLEEHPEDMMDMELNKEENASGQCSNNILGT